MLGSNTLGSYADLKHLQIIQGVGELLYVHMNTHTYITLRIPKGLHSPASQEHYQVGSQGRKPCYCMESCVFDTPLGECGSSLSLAYIVAFLCPYVPKKSTVKDKTCYTVYALTTKSESSYSGNKQRRPIRYEWGMWAGYYMCLTPLYICTQCTRHPDLTFMHSTF